MRKTYIYGLKDPRDNQIHYIGKSNYPARRLCDHMKDSGVNGLKEDWIADLRGCELSPEVVILETVQMDAWKECEKKWIAYGIEQGWPLTNISMGGTGMSEMRLYWPDFMRDFLPGDLLRKYKKLDAEKQVEIARQAALMVRKASNNRIENNLPGQFRAACDTAARLVASN